MTLPTSYPAGTASGTSLPHIMPRLLFTEEGTVRNIVNNNNNNMYFFYSAIQTSSMLMALYSIIINIKIKMNKIVIDKNVR